MAGFNEDERIRHKNQKFAEAFTAKGKALNIILGDVSLADIVATLEAQGFRVTLKDDNIMVIDTHVGTND